MVKHEPELHMGSGAVKFHHPLDRFGRFVCCQIAAKNDQIPFVVTPKGTLTRAFVVAGTGFEPVTSGL
jgi:hypothetical protein